MKTRIPIVYTYFSPTMQFHVMHFLHVPVKSLHIYFEDLNFWFHWVGECQRANRKFPLIFFRLSNSLFAYFSLYFICSTLSLLWHNQQTLIQSANIHGTTIRHPSVFERKYAKVYILIWRRTGTSSAYTHKHRRVVTIKSREICATWPPWCYSLAPRNTISLSLH